MGNVCNVQHLQQIKNEQLVGLGNSLSNLNSSFNKMRIQIHQIPTSTHNIQQKINQYAKIPLKQDQENVISRKIWKVKPPYNYIYRNEQKNQDDPPNGLCTIYKLKQNQDFGGFFQGFVVNGNLQTQNSVIIYANGSYFLGKGQKKGRYYNEKTNLLYQGGWQKQMPQGIGIQETSKGKYQGQFLNGKKSGKGQYTFADGSIYNGVFKNGVNGKGVYKDISGYVYEGEYLNSEKESYGVWKQQKQGIIYEGYFSNGQRSGRGKLTTKEGVYQGLFENELPHGYGIFKSTDGVTISGSWQKGKIIALY